MATPPRFALLRETLAPQVRIRRRTSWQRRYVGHARDAVAALETFFDAPSETWLSHALDARLAPLRDALWASPFYLETLAAHGLSPRDLGSLDDLPHFPLLDRETLGARYLDLPALDPESREAREVVAVESSGSTGDPITILKDPYDTLHMWSVLRFFCRRLAVRLPPRPRVVLLCSLTNGIEYSAGLPLLDAGRLDRVSIVRPRARERLARIAPDVVFSDPSGLHWLAAQDLELRPCVVLTSAQYFSPEQRARVALATGAPIVNYYASSDTGPMAWECPRALGRFHVLLPDVFVEAVAGELVVTRLRPSVLPLLRYRTGDRGLISRDGCACGHRGLSIVEFTGRRECRFVTPCGRSVDAWQLAWLFKHYALRAFQLTQTGPECFALRLVARAEAPDLDDLRSRLVAALGTLGFSGARVAVSLVEHIGLRGEKPEPFRSVV